MADIVITEFMDTRAVDSLRADFEVHYDPNLHEDTAGIASRLGPACALIVRNRTRVDDALLAAGPRLVAVGWLGVGLDNIDLDACAERGVAVYPVKGGEKPDQRAEQNTATAAFGGRWSEGVGMRPGAVSAGNEGRA